jgi:hypothetical protein
LASEANGREKEVEHPGIAVIFPRPHRASSSAKLLRGTTTKVEWGGEKKMKKKIGNLQKREEDTRIRRFVARKKRANANGVAEETTKTLEVANPETR